MKLLNEANLIYFSTCSSQSTKEGWLYKKGELNKSFQKRWFVLKGNLLFYFDKPGDREPNGVIILEGYTVELVDTAVEGYTFQIAFKGASNSRKYILQAESHDVMEQWMKVITCASYDYMKLMVAELKSQLDELMSQELANELASCKHREDSLDLLGEKPVTGAAAPLVQPALEEGGTDSLFAPTEQKTKGRLNPFDRGTKDSLDPFGQVPFDPQPGTAEASKSVLTVPPQAPTRKKKNSPRLLRKAANSPKTARKAANSPKTARKAAHSPKPSRKADDSLSRAKTQFYDNASEIHRDTAPPLIIKTSRFPELHSQYGQMIRSILSPLTVAESSAALIEL